MPRSDLYVTSDEEEIVVLELVLSGLNGVITDVSKPVTLLRGVNEYRHATFCG